MEITIFNIFAIIAQVCMVVLAITIHEYSHALAAYKLGDDTAKRMGRLTLNPIKHLDILGALMLLIVRIGWAKPVPINPYNFKSMKKDIALTAAAGPASNFCIAIFAAMFYNFSFNTMGSLDGSSFFVTLVLFALRFLVMINIALGLFNLIPIPPLDGSKIVGGFMPDEMYFKWASFERKGAYVLFALFGISYFLRIPILQVIIIPPLNFLTTMLIGTTF
ncbi:MAG: site-2 protease family protein [Candidatus Cloacimonetes bacterium]|nr:site-2 protease family protein [Candidatus Cloacimonadota bacterium]